jgi:hypothetical protein
MSDAPAPKPSELRDLVSEALAIEYLKSRQKPVSEPKPRWLQLFESSGFVALVTVLLGGIAGGYITFTLQDKAKERDQQTSARQLRHDRELAAFNDHLDRERKIVYEFLTVLGGVVDASRGLAHLSREEWADDHQPPAAAQRIAKARHDVVQRYNDATAAWDANRLRLGMLLQLEHNNDAALSQAYRNTCDKAEAYALCADRWRQKHTNLSASEAEQACADVRQELDSSVKVFTDRLLALRSEATAAEAPVVDKSIQK